MNTSITWSPKLGRVLPSGPIFPNSGRDQDLLAEMENEDIEDESLSAQKRGRIESVQIPSLLIA